MRKFLIPFLFVLIIFPKAQAQKCKYDVNEYDKFLKITKVEKEVKVNNADFIGDGLLKLNFCKYDSVVFFRITYSRTHSLVVGRQDEMIFLLQSGSTVKAYPDQIYSGDITYGTYSTHCLLRATYLFENNSAIDSLKSDKVKSIRINYNSVHQDYDIKGKFSDNLYNTVQCF